MKKVKLFLERAYKDIILNDYDEIVLVIGDEGFGKSTFMLETTWLWQQILDSEPDVNSVLDRVVHDDRTAFRKQLLESERQQAHVAMDAAHILYKKEAMHGKQIETEKSLLDIRTLNYFIQLGYQDWDDITDQLQRRRARHVFRIPRRGVVWGYNRSSIDTKYDSGTWPEPDLKDTFPDLDGTELWEEFQRRDEERKRERLRVDESPDADDVYRREQIKTAIRAVRPWDDDGGLTYRDAAKLVDFSPSWVSRRIQEYEDGNHRDLLQQESGSKLSAV